MKSLVLFTSCIAATLAAPTLWTPELGAVYAEASLIVRDARNNRATSPPSCDLSKFNIIDYLETIPDAPSASQLVGPGSAQLVEATVGRGVQNYTCADNNPGTVPVLVGAVANLYNVNCIAVNYPHLLSLIPRFAVQYNTSLDEEGRMMWLRISRAGHHFFNAQGSPVFDLNDDPKNQLGVLVANSKAPEMKIPAPTSASKGQRIAVNGNTGAVPWLKLDAKDGTTNGLTAVYRVDTAGGAAPSSCVGQGSSFSVQYAAQYFFYK